MGIHVTLLASEFNHSGTYEGRQFDALRIKETSKGRVYFTIIRNGMRLCTMAKQIKLVDGNAIVSFGKNDKLIIGTYEDPTVKAEVIEEEVTEPSNNTNQSNETNHVTKNIKDIKLNKQKEKILLKDYMGRGFDEYEGQCFEYEGIEFYLLKYYTNKWKWSIIEKTTKLYVVKHHKQRKEAFTEFEKFLSEHLDKMKDIINKKNAEVS